MFLPQFRRIVDEGVAVVMSAYNALNGEWCGQHRGLLTDVLRTEWGFDGFVISDWIFGLRDAGVSVAAGLDVEMPYRMIRASGLDAAVAVGECTDEDITAAVTRTVATLLRFAGVLDAEPPSTDLLACPRHRALAREAASASIVLLRNAPIEGAAVLPLDRGSLRRVAVLGRLADTRNLGDGGSSDVWAPEVVTPLAGLRAALGDTARVDHHHGGADPTAAAEVARGADVAVVVVGYTKADEGEFIGGEGTRHLAELMPGPDDPELAAAFQAVVDADTDSYQHPDPDQGVGGLGFATGGDRSSLRLLPDYEALIAAVVAANPRTVVAVVAGSAVLTGPWDRTVAAVAQVWYSGMEGGHALADVLLGRAEPTGRLPFTVPTDEGHLPPFDRDATDATYDAWHGYWRLARDGHRAAYPFGFGLSYTDLVIESVEVALDDAAAAVLVSATVANLGDRGGVEVVQVYAGAEGAPARLVAFARVPLTPAERTGVDLRVPVGRLARRDPTAHAWLPATGTHQLVIGRHVEDPAAHRVTIDLA
ncbi:hypothetical protein BH20ACT3_BH20ACT3_09250 [soil metagenome]